ncbi:choice-of-anchor A family protein [Bryobacter aggregatus]|uniref:choice-of-anchor A family protein n=1 Tax=Bryobacter aggregatus TaxID=360054 RepID=UPI0004E1B252|nr:choice-of-anchor A family protein [Bryobacter aggregatus]
MSSVSKVIFNLALVLLSTGGSLRATSILSVGDFNLFVFGNLTQANTDVQGRVAVGGTASVTNFGIGTSLSPDPSRLDLEVGGSLSWTNGQLFNGSGIYGGSAALTSVGVPNGTITNVVPNINFAQVKTEETNLSAYLAGLSAITATATPWGALTLTGTNASLNVFNVSAGVLSGINTFTFNVPTTSTVIVNIAGATNSLQNAGMNLNGLSKTQVIYNFYEATALTVQGISVQGSILAPNATLNFNNGNIEGQVIVNNLLGGGETHNYIFNGTIPTGNIGTMDPSAVPEPSTAFAGVILVAMGAWLRQRRKLN